MKLKFQKYLIILVLILSACAQSGNNPSAPQVPKLPPASHSDTPSPAEIHAPRIESPALVKLDMLDEFNGWGVTESQIVRTNDGGVTWYNVTPLDVAETGYSVDMFILDNNHVWVQKPDFEKYPHSGVLYRTIDGGSTWTNSAVPFSRGDIKFLDASNGWVLADLGVGAGSNAVAVYQTTDGGGSWDQTYTNDPNDANATDSLPLSGIKSDLVPLDMKTAWVSGVIYAPGDVYLFRTDDGGHNWTRVSLTLPSGAQNSEISIDRDQMKLVSTNDGFIALRMAGDSTQTTVYLTNDAGKTWIPTSLSLNGAGASVFLSPQEIVLYDGEQFHITRDAARTWVTVSPDIAFGETFASMDFVNLLSGWVITTDPTMNHRSLYRTTDGGAIWSPVIP